MLPNLHEERGVMPKVLRAQGVQCAPRSALGITGQALGVLGGAGSQSRGAISCLL